MRDGEAVINRPFDGFPCGGHLFPLLWDHAQPNLLGSKIGVKGTTDAIYIPPQPMPLYHCQQFFISVLPLYHESKSEEEQEDQIEMV